MDLKVVQEGLAALMYWEKPKQKEDRPVKFEDLTEAEQRPYMDRSKRVLIYIDKLGLVILSADEVRAQQVASAVRFEALRGLIRDFVGKLNHPRDVAKYFPVDELASRISREVCK